MSDQVKRLSLKHRGGGWWRVAIYDGQRRQFLDNSRSFRRELAEKELDKLKSLLKRGLFTIVYEDEFGSRKI